MRLVGVILAALLLVSGQSVANDMEVPDRTEASDNLAAWRPLIAAASQRFGVPELWIRAVIRAESGGQLTMNGLPVTSKAGAMGLMQLMPGTYAEMQQRYGLGPDSFDPEDNILAGTAYLAELRRRFGFPGLFAAYNAGPERYEEHLATGDSLPDETISYLKTIDATGLQTSRTASDLLLNAPSTFSPDAAASPLFFTLNAVTSGSVFVPLRSQTNSGR